MSHGPYSDLLKEFHTSLDDLASPEGRKRLAERLAGLAFELRLIQDFQATLMAALRARDVVARDPGGRGVATPARQIALDPRDSFEGATGLKRLEWDGEAPYRWTGPGHDAIVRVWLDRSIPLVSEIAIYSYGDDRNREAVQMFVDGARVGVAEIEHNLLRTGPFPLADDSLYTEIRIHAPWLTTSRPEMTAAPKKGVRRARRGPTSGVAEPAQDGSASQGIAFTHVRFFATS